MAEYKNILVAIDFSSSVDEISRRAVAIAKNDNAKLTFVHIVEYMPPFMMGDEPVPSSSWVINEDELVAKVKTRMGDLLKNLNVESAEQVVRVGIPKHEIISIAGEKNVDLIVTGSHGRHGVGLLLGSTANSILHHAPCDVLAVKVED